MREAAKDKDTYPAAMLRLAAIDTALGQRSEAHITLRELLDRHPKQMAARLFDARLLVADGKREEAIAEAAYNVKDDPSETVAPDSQLLVGLLQSQFDRTEDANNAFEDS